MKIKIMKYYPGENSVAVSVLKDEHEPTLNIVNVLTKSITYNFEKETSTDEAFKCLSDEEAFERLVKRLKSELKEILDEVSGRIRKLDDLKFDQVRI